MMTGYFDESLDKSTIVCAGWIADDNEWDQIIDKWDARVKYESRRSVKKGLKPLSRYHAADCSALENEFKGWSSERQIRFVKHLQNIMFGPEKYKRVRHTDRPMVFGFAASLKEARNANFGLTEKQLRQYCYFICVTQCLKEIGLVMREFHTQDRITFFHDRGDFVSTAIRAFDAEISDNEISRERFVTMAPMGWENCIPLQPADMIAHDLLHRLRNHLVGRDIVRKSLARIVGNQTPISAGAVGCEDWHVVEPCAAALETFS